MNMKGKFVVVDDAGRQFVTGGLGFASEFPDARVWHSARMAAIGVAPMARRKALQLLVVADYGLDSERTAGIVTQDGTYRAISS